MDFPVAKEDEGEPEGMVKEEMSVYMVLKENQGRSGCRVCLERKASVVDMVTLAKRERKVMKEFREKMDRQDYPV